MKQSKSFRSHLNKNELGSLEPKVWSGSNPQTQGLSSDSTWMLMNSVLGALCSPRCSAVLINRCFCRKTSVFSTTLYRPKLLCKDGLAGHELSFAVKRFFFFFFYILEKKKTPQIGDVIVTNLKETNLHKLGSDQACHDWGFLLSFSHALLFKIMHDCRISFCGFVQ